MEIRFNIFTFENDSSDHPHTPKPEKIKKFWSFIKSLKKTRLGSHHSEKTEFLRQMQRKKPIFVIGNSNQPSHVKATLTRPQKGVFILLHGGHNSWPERGHQAVGGTKRS